MQNMFEVLLMNGYMTAQEAAKKWGVTPRQVQILCKANKVIGATRMSRVWIIPENAEKPTNNKHATHWTKGDNHDSNDPL